MRLAGKAKQLLLSQADEASTEGNLFMPQPISSSSSSPSFACQPSAETHEVPPTQVSCKEELVEVARAGVAVAGSVAALVAATPTLLGVLPGIAAFVGSSLYLGGAAAELANCRDQATARPQ